MIKKRKFSGFPVLNLAILMVFLLAGCERDAVSYTVASSCASSAEAGTEVTELSDPEGLMSDASDAGQEVSDPEELPPAEIQVYVCGAVASPGVYVLPEGSRVYEAVEMAGGLLESADPKALNQARPLADGEQITVLTVEEVQNGETAEQGAGGSVSGGDGTSAGSGNGKVNINTADEDELMTLSGIGESRAKAIIAYREENGTFESIEDIMKIDGIKEKMFEKIRDSITV